MLTYTTDIFNGVIVDLHPLPPDPGVFRSALVETIQHWKQQGYQLAWIDIPAARALLIPEAVALGFIFHHTAGDALTLTLQLHEGAFVPPPATHYVGVGGMILSEENELLVVQEKRHIQTRPGFYKLPGGLLDQGETISQAAEREVWEETGIRTEFQCLVGYFSHQMTWQFGKSALYHICRLKPMSREITIDEQEIAEAKWMPVEEFMALDTTHIFNKNLVQMVRRGIGMSPVNWPTLSDSVEVFAPS